MSYPLTDKPLPPHVTATVNLERPGFDKKLKWVVYRFENGIATGRFVYDSATLAHAHYNQIKGIPDAIKKQ